MAAFDFVRKFQGEFDQLASYACLDAATFDGCINPGNKIMIRDRLSRANDRKAKDAGAAAALQFGVQWNANALKNVYDRVLTERAGVCTTFAKAAAHILTKDNHINAPKIEIVAYSNHVFLIVGREAGEVQISGVGPFAKHKLSHYNTWGFGWMIVDVWAGAMGWPKTIYVGHNGYPFKSMLNPLTLVMTTG